MVGIGRNTPICYPYAPGQSFTIAEAGTDDSYSGLVILLADLFYYQ